jgi:hypothetical protein
MNGIYLQFLLEFLLKFLKEDDFEYEHLDNFGIAVAVNYFPGNIAESFDSNSCISLARLTRILSKFRLQSQIQQIQNSDCMCN